MEAATTLHFNLFEIMGLDPSDKGLTLRAVRIHKKMVVKHVFERGARSAQSIGFWVPTWAQVNMAINQLEKDF